MTYHGRLHTRVGLIALALSALLLALTGAPTQAAAAGPPLITDTSFSQVTQTSALLKATVNPNNRKTEYHFEYVDRAGFEANGFANASKAPVPDGVIPSGDEPVPVLTPVSGLSPATAYRFRIVATNLSAPGGILGPERSFTTYAPSPIFGPCPNEGFRSGSGANLPDCRAYEQASSTDKNGIDAGGGIFHVQVSLSGDAITFSSTAGLPGGIGAQEFPDFLARRGSGAWSTQGVLPPPSFGQRAKVLGWTPDLAYVFDSAELAGAPGAAFLSRSSADVSMAKIVDYTPNTNTGSYAFVGASADNSKVFFEAKGPGVALAPGAASGKDNLYLWDRDTNTVSLVGALPAGEGGSAPPGGSFAGPYDWWHGTNATTLARGGALGRGEGDSSAGGGYFTQEQHTVSTTGDSAYFTAGESGQIYLRKGLDGSSPSTDHVTASEKDNGLNPDGTDPHGPLPAAFQLATPDGAHAFFTSSEELTNNANTGPDTVPAIARADIGGSLTEPHFILQSAQDVDLDANYVYWVNAHKGNPGEGTIGRATLDGTTEVDPDFITGADNPQGIAVDGAHIYWTNAAGEEEDEGTIGRADLNGNPAGVKQDFITGASDPKGIDVDGSHIYWVNVKAGTTVGGGAIGRSDLAGTSASVEQVFINGRARGDVAVNATTIYYSRSNDVDSFIDSSDLAGGDSGITGIEVFGAKEPPRIALDSSHLYWTNPSTEVLGRSDLDGTPASWEQSFIAAEHPSGVAVDASNVYWSSSPPQDSNPGNDLYRYGAETGDLSDLTPDAVDPNGAEVKGVIGASEDGSYVYFVANADLDGGGPATAGNCTTASASFSATGSCNLYRFHEGDPIAFIARLDVSGAGDLSDAANWAPNPDIGSGFTRVSTARVSADGQTILFRSRNKLSDYENAGTPELYRFQVGDPGPICVSCAPSGALPSGRPTLRSIAPPTTGVSGKPIFTRNLSADGDRVFFESPDKLVGADTNGDQVCPSVGGSANNAPTCQDVYEWEAEGSGSCHTAGGCVYLLSTGNSTSPSYLGDASLTGDDVFIFTRQQLVPADQDQLQDVYDVSVGGGLFSQRQLAPVPCEGEACKAGATPQPQGESAGTSTFSGPPDPKGKKPKPRCPKRKRQIRNHGKTRCVAKHKRER